MTNCIWRIGIDSTLKSCDPLGNICIFIISINHSQLQLEISRTYSFGFIASLPDIWELFYL